MTTTLIRLRDAEVVRTGRDRRFILRVPTFTLTAREAVALVAPSGFGKSTFINLLALATPPDTVGAFTITDIDAAGLWRRRANDALARLRSGLFGYVVQTGALLPSMTARENIALGQRIAGRRDDGWLQRVADRLGVAKLLADRPDRLSVGERQRVAIARAIAHRPSIVLADEPTAALDPANKAAVMTLLLELRDEFGFALVIASHDLESVDQFGIARLAPTIEVARHDTRSIFARASAPASGGLA